ncbi:hypothetical protein Tsubulata_029327 [Turnera subulata]|uniref:Remorin C-terminal domain-containing protein n=1 Tax=Turnera subulata TaxID=218843 RepID=A0A9Q0JHG1_9ROSI|nr:hypothetical protein Tsubulata_029327 [Turnera subulata]
MKQNLVSSQSLGTFPSPGPGTYQENKGWSSERIPHQSRSSRRHISALSPFYSGRTLPSKWEDAERWICSPVLGYGSVAKSSQFQQQRRPKSKSGPINVPPGIAYYPNYSPSLQGHDGGGASLRNFVVNSPFSTGVLMPQGVGVHFGGYGGNFGGRGDVERMVSLPGWSDLASESSSVSSQDEKLDGINDADNGVNRTISRRDMATQMSPEDSTLSSPRGRSSSPPPIAPTVETQTDASKIEIREVQVDKRATMISWSKRHNARRMRRESPDMEDLSKNAALTLTSSSWDISEATSDVSKLQREEAKISAWENLQKAKAEAAIRKLEMKLEKKRASSMDKILNKLRTAETKAQEMRSSVVKQDHQTSRTSHKAAFFHRTRFNCFTGCFTCHAF